MNKEAFTLKEVLFIFSITIMFLMMGISYDIPLFIAMLPGVIALWIIGMKHQYTFRELVSFSWKGMVRNRHVAWLLFFIGVILPTWYYSGTIHDINSLFLTFISPTYFFTIAFLVTALMSMIVGSTIASLSIVGVPMMTAAEQLGLPSGVVAGALVSGGFVGDRTSPISSSFQLLRMSVEIDNRLHLRAIIPTMLWGVGITAMLFLAFDIFVPKGDISLNNVISLEDLNLFQITVSLLPPLSLLIMILLKQEMKLSFSVAIGMAIVILLLRGVDAVEWLQGLFTGVGSLSGVLDMLPFVLFILIVGAYCQIMENTNIVQPFVEKFFSNKTSLKKNTAQTIGIAAGVSLISPNQSFPIILTGRTLLPHWKAYFSKEDLARILADSTVVFAGLVPWSLLAILCSTIIGVPVLNYAPFALFLIVQPFITWLYSTRVKRDYLLDKAV
ncbi:Na+/H+ antiporter NhaC family protein [Evansella sp. AB-P1]|uniref:Na+/H+ antiporter NhaC family protein n=1 Tax=Evansella sp. AB-P1 TaxID=3037653 RepID=UPI00241FEB84|nr:Na+/H+ antiporter NhaC family protein [Evansella sp. AB-P1]MDG5789834.1 Na+/H+ antiporter NhaC family protein [Evansella sp. AB-P1]